jgi:hypothetical protein
MWDDVTSKIFVKETGWGGIDWIHLAQDQDKWWFCEHGNESSSSTKSEDYRD